VFGLKLKSPNAAAILKAGLAKSHTLENLARTYHPIHLYNIVKQLHATVEFLPSAYFDPDWVLFDVYETARAAASQRYGIAMFVLFFQEKRPNIQVTDFYPGAFAFHWHNQWKKHIEEGTIPSTFLKYYERKEAAGRLK